MLLDYSEDTRRNLKFGRDPTKRKVDFRTHHFKKAKLREKWLRWRGCWHWRKAQVRRTGEAPSHALSDVHCPSVGEGMLASHVVSLMRTLALALGAIRQRWTKHEGAAVMRES